MPGRRPTEPWRGDLDQRGAYRTIAQWTPAERWLSSGARPAREHGRQVARRRMYSAACPTA